MWQKSPTEKTIFSSLIVFLFLFILVLSASAATVTWSGGGADNLASNSANWSGGIIPQNGDDVVFDSTSTDDCTWDIYVVPASLTLNLGYAGTFTLNSDLRITGDLIIQDGTFNLNGNNLEVGFVASSQPPTAVTDPATNINGNSATLNATINPNGSETTVYFEWGTSTPYDNTTTGQSIGSGTLDVSVSDFIMGLSPSTTYYYRVVATNAGGTVNGDDMSFTTTAGTYISSGTISTDTTWTYAGSPYIVTGNITIYGASEPTLTIEPGVVVKFDCLCYLYIGHPQSYAGRLNAQGTSSAPIIFTSNKPATEKTPGDWAGISFFYPASTASVLDYVTVEYGYGSSGANINITRDNSLTIKNSTIRYSANHGISVAENASVTIIDSTVSNNSKKGISAYGTGNVIITGTTISNNGDDGIYVITNGDVTITGSIISGNSAYGYYVGGSVSSASISNTSFTNNGTYGLSIPAYVSLGTGNTASGNGADGIELRGAIISADTTWSYQSIPYVVTGNITIYGASEPTLTIEPGVVVKFDCLCYLYIGHPQSYAGRLNAQGTADKPIIFTSNKPATEKTPGDWAGISFFYPASTASVLDYVTVEYGYGSSGANINITRDNSLTIKNSTIRYSANHGISVAENASVTIIDSTVSNNSKKGISAYGTGTLTVTDSTISDNTTNGIYAVSTVDINISFSIIKNNGDYAVYLIAPVVTVQHSNITGNGNGIYSNLGNIVDTRFNWWGDVSGPSVQGPGTGQSVSSGIIFEPWLGTPFTYPFYNTDLQATIQGFNPLNTSVSYTFSISEDADWTFSIKNSGGTTVRTFTGSGTNGSVLWNGKDEGGIIVPDGTYTYQLDSTRLSDSFQSAPFIGDVVVNQAMPEAEITYPVEAQWIDGNSPIDIQGTASDSNDFKDYKVEYGIGTSPITWTLITSSTTPVTAGTLAAWDTTNLNGIYYTLRLSVTDNAGNTATDSVTVILSNIYNFSVSQPYFSPNGDGSKDTTTITAGLTHYSDWTVDIKNPVGTVVRIFTGSGTSISAMWDGKNSSGVIQPEDEYSFLLTATESGSGTSNTRAGTITIDVTPPVAEITSPTENEVVFEVVPIIGSAYDAVAKFGHGLTWRPGTDPDLYGLNMQSINTTVNVTDGVIGEWKTHFHDIAKDWTPFFVNGPNAIKLVVTDKAGNIAVDSVVVILKNAYVEEITASVNFDPSSNQSSTINYTLAAGGLTTIMVGTTNAYFRYLIQDVKRPEGQNTDYWDGRNSLGELVPAGDYVIAIYTTTDPNPMPATAPRITNPLATPARFDPTTDIGATISYNLSKDAAVTVGIYDTDDNLITNVITGVSQLQGSNSVIWDGKNNSGNNVYPGAYRYKIVATDSNGDTGPEIMGIAQVYY